MNTHMAYVRTLRADQQRDERHVPAPMAWQLHRVDNSPLLADCPDAPRFVSTRPAPKPILVRSAPAAHRAEPLDQDTAVMPLDNTEAPAEQPNPLSWVSPTELASHMPGRDRITAMLATAGTTVAVLLAVAAVLTLARAVIVIATR